MSDNDRQTVKYRDQGNTELENNTTLHKRLFEFLWSRGQNDSRQIS